MTNTIDEYGRFLEDLLGLPAVVVNQIADTAFTTHNAESGKKRRRCLYQYSSFACLAPSLLDLMLALSCHPSLSEIYNVMQLPHVCLMLVTN